MALKKKGTPVKIKIVKVEKEEIIDKELDKEIEESSREVIE
jgi:hypothetical protein